MYKLLLFANSHFVGFIPYYNPTVGIEMLLSEDTIRPNKKLTGEEAIRVKEYALIAEDAVYKHTYFCPYPSFVN